MQDAKLLYVGCGTHRMDGFVHMELNPWKSMKHGSTVPAPEILGDMVEHIPAEDGFFDLIFSRGTLEHLRYPELVNHLLEAYRVLRVGGVVRMVVPDFENFITCYRQGVYFGDSWEMPEMPNEDHVDEFVRQMLYHDHYYLHNFTTLSRVLEKTGFVNIRECAPGDSSIPAAGRELLRAESGRLHEIIIEAEKGTAAPTASRANLWPASRLVRLMNKWLNWDVSRCNKRRPMFPQRLWWAEQAARWRSRGKTPAPFRGNPSADPDVARLKDFQVGVFAQDEGGEQ